MRYRLLTLIGIVTAFAFVFALTLRRSSIVSELRRDLQLPSQSRIWLVGETRSESILAVSEIANEYTLFSAARIPEPDGISGRWTRAFYVNLQAKSGENAMGAYVAKCFSHFPTDAEVANFCDAHRIEVTRDSTDD